MSTKKGGRTRCPKCDKRMSKPSRYEWLGFQAETSSVPSHLPAWQTICLACVREHFADPLLHLRHHKMANVREKV